MSEAENRIDTLCGNCVFAAFDGDIQTGCDANILERHKAKGKEVELRVLGDCKCYMVKDCVCYYWRPERWLEQFPAVVTTEELTQQARKELTLKADIIVYCDEQTDYTQITRTVESIRDMELKPIRVYFANQMCYPSEFLKWVNQNIHDLPWRIETITQPQIDARAIDFVAEKCTGMYISIFRAGFEIPADFLSAIDTALYDNLERFLYLEPAEDINGLTYMRQLHKTLVGNKYGPLKEQLKELCLSQNCPNMIRPLKAIVPSM